MKNRKIGIIGAMDVEVEGLKKAAQVTREKELAGMRFCEGRLGEKQVVIVKCGMGKVNAGVCAQLLISIFGVTHVINTGVAGSLDDALDIGDIVVSTDAVQHDFDVSPIGYARGEIPYTGLYAFPADEDLREKALGAVREAAPQVHAVPGRICSGDQFIASQTQKQAIVSAFGGKCCEMEGAAIAQVCWLNHVPFVILRAVSDKADDSAGIPFAQFEAQAAEISQNVVRRMLAQL